jgi:hypothetical protein
LFLEDAIAGMQSILFQGKLYHFQRKSSMGKSQGKISSWENVFMEMSSWKNAMENANGKWAININKIL